MKPTVTAADSLTLLERVVRLRWGLVALTVVTLVAVGCGGDGGAGQSEQSVERVTLEEYHQVKKGWSEDEVRDLLGDPVRTESDCWFYGGVLPEPTTEICFENGEVALKKQYADK